MQTIPDEGKVDELELQHSEDMTLRLFVNNITPDRDTVLADFTECTVGGYAAKTLTGGSWDVSDNGTEVVATYAAQEFTFTGSGETAYGWYLEDAAGTVVRRCALFDAPITITADVTITVNPSFEKQQIT